MKPPSESVNQDTHKEATVRALEGATDIGSAALGVGVHVVADTASQAARAVIRDVGKLCSSKEPAIPAPPT